MGSGKSTVGPRAAERLGWSFLDLDERIETQAGKPIPAIFEEDGEESFRAMERAALRRTAERERAVVALGGGALANEDNLRVAKAQGFVMYLSASASELAQRLRDEASHRPLLQDATGQPLSDEALHAKIASMLSERAPFYEQAHAAIYTDAQSASETVDAVIAAYEAHPER